MTGTTVGLLRETFEESEPKKIYGVVTGTVINTIDPLLLGRVQIQLPFLSSLDVSPWARVAVPMAGATHGTYFIPGMGDEVLVAFEHGDVNAPYVIGCLWNATQPPPVAVPIPYFGAIRTPSGNQIVITELPPSVTLQTGPTPPEAIPLPASPVGPHQTIEMSPIGIQIMTPTSVTIQVDETIVSVTPASITLDVGASSIAMTPGGIYMHAPIVTIQGHPLNLNPFG